MQKINRARLKTLGDENIINQRKDSLMKLKMKPQIQKNITIISVSYNSTDVIERMLASVPKDIALIVVDNGSDDLTLLKEICSRYSVILLENGKNVGFGAACNFGAKYASTEFLFFVNPDCVLETDTIQELLASARRNPLATAFNPRIILDDGQPSFNYKSALLPRSKWMARGWPKIDQEVNVLSGCALLVRQSHFNAVGGFDENIFLYHEDDDLSLRLTDKGPLMFSYKSLISHSVASSSGHSENIIAFKAWHLGYSRVYTMKKHRRFLPIAFLYILAFGKILLPDVIFLRTKRKKRWAYLLGISSGLLRILR